MIRSIATLRSVGTWIVVVFALLGCTKVKQDDTAAETAQAAASSNDTTFVIDPGDVYPEDWSTPLPPGVDSNAVTFGNQLAGLAVSGTQRVRSRAGKCNAGNCPVVVQIAAVSPTRTLSPTMVPGTPRAVARLRNLHGSRTEAYYGLKPVSQAVYYLWVNNAGGKTRITTLEVPNVGKVRAGRQKDLEVCHAYAHGADSTNFGDADFAEYRPEACDGSKAVIKKAAPARLSLSLVSKVMAWARIALPPVTLQAEGGWIDCNSGCCW